MPHSLNFSFLQIHDSQLVRLGTLAERYFTDDPNTCLIKLRQFSELLAQLAAANIGLYEIENERQLDLLNRLRDRGLIKGDIERLFHELRKIGNSATHEIIDNHRLALSGLKYARALGIWFHRVFTKNPNFDPGAFVPPSDPKIETEALKTELNNLREELQHTLSEVELAQTLAAIESQKRINAEKLAQEIEANFEQVKQHLTQLQIQSQQTSKQSIQQTIDQSQIAESRVFLDERETRKLIDSQLQAAGWEANSEELTYQNGTRPQKGKNLAIAEYPTTNGRADYALFCGLQIIAVVEAKRQSTDISEGALNQAKRYSEGFKITGEIFSSNLSSCAENKYQVPFVFATNGRPYLQQLETKSGIWFCDLRRPTNLRKCLPTWYSPQGLLNILNQDIDQANHKLKQEPFNYGLQLRDYQIRAIQAVETALSQPEKQSLLLAMATGTGKTKTCIALVYRLLKTKRFRRILFLVDRTALGEQTHNSFNDSRMENLQTFADIFEIKGLKDSEIDTDTKVHIATVQSMVKRVLGNDNNVITPDQYDCIVVDECHRGYLLDRELSDQEIEFRDFNDYVSKYRRVLEHFDAVKIGLTATPALHTTEIFGKPVYEYTYKEAVIDGWLIDHELPINIKTKLSEEGIIWNVGDEMQFFNPQTGQLDLIYAPDEVKIEVEQFNKKVITIDFNRVVCETLTQYIDPSLPAKTLIFCANDDHANTVVEQLRKAFQAAYDTIEDEAIIKITGKADKPLELIRKFRNEVNPKIAVTVDLLTTGIDIPSISNLVFIRRVNSRILYDQMIGRATRLCPDINKEVFRIFDAVKLYEAISQVSNMKPVVVNPHISFTQLITELTTVEKPELLETIIDQLLAKIQRKRRNLTNNTQEQLELMAGMSLTNMISYLKNSTPQELKAWWQERKTIAEILDRQERETKPILISHHRDELVAVERGYGNAERPEDYLESFRAFLLENMNKIPALIVVTQRPRELTRKQLKELKMQLDAAGYTETNLKIAWQEMTNEEIAASIIGFIRQAALGDALIPYSERVEKAIKKVLASQTWTDTQRQWLERIGKQLKVETIVDKDALEQGEFKRHGGFTRLNKIFNGELESIVIKIHDSIWDVAN